MSSTGPTASGPGDPAHVGIQHEHSDVTGGWLRPAVFGAMDGLVSNVALIAGVAGGTQGDAKAVVLAGLAGMSAGAFSMAVGEYTSVASQSEAAAREIAKERTEIENNNAAETIELAGMYTKKGVDRDLALEVAKQIHEDVDTAVSVHAKEEFGIDTDDLASPMVAAVSSFLAFAVGALVPLVPYLVGATGLWPALALTFVALFVCGAMVTQLTVRPWWYGGLRQMLLGAAAAGLTFAVGNLVGASGLG